MTAREDLNEDLLEIPAFLKRKKGTPISEPTEPLKSIAEIERERELAEREAAKAKIKDIPVDFKPAKAPRKSPREAMKEQISNYIGELEEG